MKNRIKYACFAAAASAALFSGMAAAAMTEDDCPQCSGAYYACQLAGGGDTCWFKYETCRLNSGCWVD